MLPINHESTLDRCQLDHWPPQDRVESVIYCVNTFSAILAVLERGDGPRSIQEIRTRIAEHAFDTSIDR